MLSSIAFIYYKLKFRDSNKTKQLIDKTIDKSILKGYNKWLVEDQSNPNTSV